jgi:signal transduction histidine kinase
LFYVKQITQAQGGQVNVESALGIGSKFFVELPKIKHV